MISRLSHATVWVLDQEEARRFYTEKLGFEVRIDHTIEGGFRWLTVGPKDQPDLQLVLMAAKPSPFMDAETAATIQALVKKGALGPGVLYTPELPRDLRRAEAPRRRVHPAARRPVLRHGSAVRGQLGQPLQHDHAQSQLRAAPERDEGRRRRIL